MRDKWRQLLNLVFSLTTIGTTVIAFAPPGGEGFDLSEEGSDTPLVPAGYAFIIWSFIYASALAYSVWQALPAQRESALLRRIGWLTASAYIATTAWLLMARFRVPWGTVACIVWILASLGMAWKRIVRHPDALSQAEKLLVEIPVGVFAGWVSVATFANLSTELKTAGLGDAGLSENNWAIVFLLLAGGLGAGATRASGAKRSYGLTLIWALAAIVVANLSPQRNAAVAGTAAAMTFLVALALGRAWGSEAAR